MKTVTFEGKRVHIYLPKGGIRLKIWTHMQPEEAEALFALLPDGAALFAADDYDWNADLSPWAAPACFRGGEGFAGNAPQRLKWLLQAVPFVEEGLSDAPRAVLGYSLAGLFALWAAAQCDLFNMTASVSGSLWFDGFDDYLAAHANRFAGKKVYLSLGDREAKTRNPRLACVQERTEAARELLSAAGAYSIFELNPGNHFAEPAARCARAAAWLMQEQG